MKTDGRDIDTGLAQLSGEAATQRAGSSGELEAWSGVRGIEPTYYGRPLLKEPVWKVTIPLYYFVGGAAGASLVMGAAAQLDRSGKLDHLMRRCHWAGVIGSALSGLILIHDLGRPERFHHMLRVFRPTSPMNMGVWILTTLAPAAGVAALFANRGGLLGTLGDVSGVAAGVAGLGLATYTGVLVANTAIPVWQESRSILPILFGASAMASAGCIFDIAFDDPLARRVTYTFGTIGRTAELVASLMLENRAARTAGLVAEPLKRGPSGILWKTATALTAASLIVSLLPGKSRKKRIAAGVLGALGSLTLRYGIHMAGVASARDPKATFRQQRAAES
jgi:hypothetical protein